MHTKKKGTSRPMQEVVTTLMRKLAIKSGIGLARITQLHHEIDIAALRQGGDDK